MGGVSNILKIDDDWFGESIDEEYRNINLSENNDNKVFNMLQSLFLYNNIPYCQYNHHDVAFSYIPMTSIFCYTDTIFAIEHGHLDEINEEIYVKFGMAFDDFNELNLQLKLKYFPDIKHWGIHLFEI